MSNLQMILADLPISVILFFLLTTLISLLMFMKTVRNNRKVLIPVVIWLVLHSAIALTGYYAVTGFILPRTAIGVFSPLVLIAVLFISPRGRRFLDTIDLKWAILHQMVRVLVEINLYIFFLHKQASEMMTLEGGNLDILSGLTAPLAWYLYSKGTIRRKGLLVWNFICLGFVVNAIVRSILTAPFPFQVWSFEQPTTAPLYFPAILLLVYIVPAVLFCHFVSIRQLLLKKDNDFKAN